MPSAVRSCGSAEGMRAVRARDVGIENRTGACAEGTPRRPVESRETRRFAGSGRGAATYRPGMRLFAMHSRGRSVRLACVLSIVTPFFGASGAWADVLSAREISAPPRDVVQGTVAPPVPTTARSRFAILAPSEDGTVRFALAEGRAASLVVIPHPATDLRAVGIELIAPDGTTADVGAAGNVRGSRSTGDIGPLFGTAGWIAERFDLVAPTAGTWIVRSAVRGARAADVPAIPWLVVLADGTERELTARWSSLQFVRGRPMQLDLAWSDGMPLVPEDLTIAVTAPGGAAVRPSVHDGSIRFVPEETGTHVVHVATRAPAPRSIGLVVTVSNPVAVTGVMRGTSVDGVHEPLDILVDASDAVVFAAAEVWTADGDGSVPVCWTGALGAMVERDGRRAARLMFDRRWANAAGAREGATLELRNVRIHDRATWMPVDVLDRVVVGPAVLAPRDAPADLVSMTRGRPGGRGVPVSLDSLPAQDDAAIGSHALLIVHGYCSSGVTFPPAHFTGEVATFLDPNQAKSNDAFAQTLLAFGNQFKSYGVAAHSQGGLASLHLYAFYWSGLDWAGPGIAGSTRLVQSVGSPYQGTPLAGNLAVLGQLFGSGCGSVTDLTPDGAAAWLSTIPTWARDEVWYWTTSFEDGPFLDYCNLLTDFFLTDPDDGVVEKFRGQLPGGHNMGHTEGWCHIEGMADPPQCTDASRNAQINAEAAR